MLQAIGQGNAESVTPPKTRRNKCHAYNKDLSQRRAKAVVDYLTGKGVAAARLTSAGYGDTQPVSSNSTKEGRQLNRRTEFKVLGK